jgi:hypothetical protein
MPSKSGRSLVNIAHFVRSDQKNQAPRQIPRPDSHTARGVHPTVLPSWFHIVTTIAGVKLNSGYRSLAVTDQLFLVEKLQRAISFRVNGISKAAVNRWEHGHDRAALMIVGCIINLLADGKFRHREPLRRISNI